MVVEIPMRGSEAGRKCPWHFRLLGKSKVMFVYVCAPALCGVKTCPSYDYNPRKALKAIEDYNRVVKRPSCGRGWKSTITTKDTIIRSKRPLSELEGK